jgi:adenylate kinase family enzyme
MEKIVIIGSAGSGKSTLARKLYSILNIKVVHLDRVFWQPGWKEKPRDTRIDILQNLVRKKRWIIEGTYLSSSGPRLDAADTIIFLDINPLLCLVRIIRRYRPFLRLRRIIKGQRECQELMRRDIPYGCTDKLTLFRVLKVLVFPFRGRRTLKQKLPTYHSKEIIWLRSSKEVDVFLARLKQHSDEKRQFSKTPSFARKRPLAVARR